MTDWISKYGDLMVRLELEMELVDHLTVSFGEAQHLDFYDAYLTSVHGSFFSNMSSLPQTR